MKKSLNQLWIVYITIQYILHYGQAKMIKKISSDPLGMDEAYLTISNKNYSDPILFLYNVVACEHCDFEILADPVPMDSNETLTISTQYPYNFQLFIPAKNTTLTCQIESYRFSEHGSYFFEITGINQNGSSCTIQKIGESSYYWTPIIVAIILLCFYIFFIQLCHYIYRSRYFNRILINFGHQGSVNYEPAVASPSSPLTDRRGPSIIVEDNPNNDNHDLAHSNSELPLVGSTRISDNSIKITKVLPKRLRSLDTFRGFSLMIMIFVNYGGGDYWFFNHSVWNGLTLADLVFPWFVWMMGVSIVLSQRSLLKKKVTKISILIKICRRTAILFLLGIILNGGHGKPTNLRILGVLQRLALCYFFTAVLVLIFDDAEDEFRSSQWPIGDDVHQPMRTELRNTVFNFWPQWLFIIFVTLAWLFITFIPQLDGCPRGYIGPGGKHEHGRYQNCTGGMAGYIDRKILGIHHIYGSPTCKEVYNTQIPFDPEGLLGILTGILLCYLGVQAGHSFAYSTRVRRVCAQWLVSGLICGVLGLILSQGGHSESWIPINKNLWSLTFIFILASLAFIILTVFYLLVDVYKVFTGEPFLWLGMNSIVLYCGHEICSSSFPIQFEVDGTHAKRLAMNVYGAVIWSLIAGIMYFKKVFIAI